MLCFKLQKPFSAANGSFFFSFSVDGPEEEAGLGEMPSGKDVTATVSRDDIQYTVYIEEDEPGVQDGPSLSGPDWIDIGNITLKDEVSVYVSKL